MEFIPTSPGSWISPPAPSSKTPARPLGWAGWEAAAGFWEVGRLGVGLVGGWLWISRAVGGYAGSKSKDKENQPTWIQEPVLNNSR